MKIIYIIKNKITYLTFIKTTNKILTYIINNNINLINNPKLNQIKLKIKIKRLKFNPKKSLMFKIKQAVVIIELF